MVNPQKAEATPENKTGKFVDETNFVTEQSTEEAIATYNRACARLLNPPLWQQLTPGITATFKISIPGNKDPRRLLLVNDFLKIDIPGPGPAAGNGHDWVKVETIEENSVPGMDDSLAMRLRACSNPNTEDEAIAHFFDAEATSTFIVQRKENTVTVSYHGRNEVPNTSNVALIDKVRNTVVALGAKAGFSELFWKALVKGLLQKEIGG